MTLPGVDLWYEDTGGSGTPVIFLHAASEINDYLRLNPEREQMVRGTLSYFHLRWFAPRVNSTTLLMAGADGAALDAALDPSVQSMPGETEVHKAEHSGFKDGRRSQEWLSRRFGMSEPSLPPHWQG